MSRAIGPGDWVECVDAAPRHGGRRGSAAGQLRRGALYRVRAIAASEGLLLYGITAADEDRGYGWYADRFRPIYPGGKLIPLLLEKQPEADRVPA